MQLKIVVLPAPFGPISPTMWPRSTSNETSSLATSPPKRLVTWRTSSRLIGAPRPTGTSAGPPRGRGPAWERPGARPAKYRVTQDVSLLAVVRRFRVAFLGRHALHLARHLEVVLQRGQGRRGPGLHVGV